MKKIKLIVFDTLSGKFVHPEGKLNAQPHKFNDYYEVEKTVVTIMKNTDWKGLDRLQINFEAVDEAERAKATILAALRYWQREGLISDARLEHRLASDNGKFEPLNFEEIDEAFSKINKGKVTYE